MGLELYHSTVLIEAAKTLAPLNVIAHGKVPYQNTQLKSIAHGVHPRIAQCVVPTRYERSINCMCVTLPTLILC